MEMFGLGCVFAYCCTALFVAVRVLRLATQTGEAPETLIGLSLLIGGAIGYPLSVVGTLLATGQPDLALRLTLAGTLALHLSSFLVALSWCAIYHRGQAWSRWVVVAVSILLFCSVIDRSASLDAETLVAAGRTGSVGYLISLAIQLLAHVLNAASGIHYYSKLRRRVRIDLADPIVANRIGLWSATSCCVVIQYGYSLASPFLSRSFDALAYAPVFVGSLGLFIASFLMLAFLPPPFYTRWIRGAAEAS